MMDKALSTATDDVINFLDRPVHTAEILLVDEPEIGEVIGVPCEVAVIWLEDERVCGRRLAAGFHFVTHKLARHLERWCAGQQAAAN